MLLGSGLWGLFILFRTGVKMRLEYLYNAFFLSPVLLWSFNTRYGFGSSPAPDAVVSLLGVAVGGALICLLDLAGDDERSGEWSRRARYGALVVLLFAAAGLTVKLSFAVLGAAAVVLAYTTIFRLPNHDGQGRWIRLTACSAVVCVLFLGPWVIHGVILSGYVAYPLSIGAALVDWKMPSSMVKEEAALIKSWARMPRVRYEQVLADWRWLTPWTRTIVQSYRFDVIFPLGATVVGLLLVSVKRLRDGAASPGTYRLFLLVPTLSLIFWFFSAPAPRFAGACFWMPAIGSVSILLVSSRVPAVRIAVLILFAVVIWKSLDSDVVYPRHPKNPGQDRLGREQDH